MTIGGLEDRDCITRSLRVHGYHTHADEFGDLGPEAPRRSGGGGGGGGGRGRGRGGRGRR